LLPAHSDASVKTAAAHGTYQRATTRGKNDNSQTRHQTYYKAQPISWRRREILFSKKTKTFVGGERVREIDKGPLPQKRWGWILENERRINKKKPKNLHIKKTNVRRELGPVSRAHCIRPSNRKGSAANFGAYRGIEIT